ncbi:hypothetical protein Salat_1281000 [Sesamum alatum]|uniref:Pectinesterase inhibitor domain-containing protein n=1 Tax=Sesamum alatum TaxID=300844 RepID=A0AAE1YGU5_9LAMI|nr:hypothetical protein Salat_1281000 [Sesamum alatum]
MAPRKLNYLFLAMAALLLLFAAESPSVDAQTDIGVNPWCRTASAKRLCTRMVTGATNRRDASINALRSTLKHAKRLRGRIHLVRPAIAGLGKTSQDSIMASCNNNFDGTIDDLENSLRALEAEDIGPVKSRLRSAQRSECEVALSEFQVRSPLARYSKLLSKEVSNCLAVILQT